MTEFGCRAIATEPLLEKWLFKLLPFAMRDARLSSVFVNDHRASVSVEALFGSVDSLFLPTKSQQFLREPWKRTARVWRVGALIEVRNDFGLYATHHSLDRTVSTPIVTTTFIGIVFFLERFAHSMLAVLCKPSVVFGCDKAEVKVIRQ